MKDDHGWMDGRDERLIDLSAIHPFLHSFCCSLTNLHTESYRMLELSELSVIKIIIGNVVGRSVWDRATQKRGSHPGTERPGPVRLDQERLLAPDCILELPGSIVFFLVVVGGRNSIYSLLLCLSFP